MDTFNDTTHMLNQSENDQFTSRKRRKRNSNAKISLACDRIGQLLTDLVKEVGEEDIIRSMAAHGFLPLDMGTSSISLRQAMSGNANFSSSKGIQTLIQNNKLNGPLCETYGCPNYQHSNGHCQTHGGRRCRESGCSNLSVSHGFCVSHGGGRRCEVENCNRSARRKSLDGIYRCSHHTIKPNCASIGCEASAVGVSRFCSLHGTKICLKNGCNKKVRSRGLCSSHGGGRMCETEGCKKGARNGFKFCTLHGGGKRCSKTGCSRVARGNPPLCSEHGGQKRCKMCNQPAISKGLCWKHGAFQKCKIGNCQRIDAGNGYCTRHADVIYCNIDGCNNVALNRTERICQQHSKEQRDQHRNDQFIMFTDPI